MGYIAETLQYENTIPADLISIEEGGLSNTALRSLDLKQAKLQRIGAGAFAECRNLRFIRIPSTVTEIENDAIPQQAVIICPAGSEALYYAGERGIDFIVQ